MAASASANGGSGGGGKAGGKKFVPLPDGAPFSQAELDTTLKVHSVAFGHQPAPLMTDMRPSLCLCLFSACDNDRLLAC